MNKQLIFERLMSLSATYLQVLAMAATIAEIGCAIRNSYVHHSIVLSVSSTPISTYTEAKQTLLAWELQ